MKYLITGCNGFIASHLASFLVSLGLEVCGTVRCNRKPLADLGNSISTLNCDITDRAQIQSTLSKAQPDVVFHLAARSGIQQSWAFPEETFKVNAIGSMYLLDALRQQANDPLVIVVCSASEYGYREKTGTLISEQSKLCALNPYAISKVTQDLIADMYWKKYGLKTIRVRPFNITGPRMIGDASSDFAAGISRIEKGIQSSITVGDLSPVRDITDIKDAVLALYHLVQHGKFGEVYNLCSGVGYCIGDILKKLIDLSYVNVQVNHKPLPKCKGKHNIQVGNNKKLKDLGWKPTISIDQTLLDLLTYWREIKGY
jgi:GDP-4-dehydro-6-deoxy-D-mannose reductase